MKVVIGAPEISFLIILSAFLIGWSVSRYHYKKRLEDTDKRLELRDDQIQSLKTDNGKLEANNEKLQSQLKAQVLMVAPGVFEIVQKEWSLGWREKGGAEPYPLRQDVTVPADATLVLRVWVRIKAIPARVVEDVVLMVAGNRIRSAHPWQPRSVDDYEPHLYFDIPPYIEPAYHKVGLIAECEGGIEERSPIFRVPLTRTYTAGL